MGMKNVSTTIDVINEILASIFPRYTLKEAILLSQLYITSYKDIPSGQKYTSIDCFFDDFAHWANRQQ